MQLMKQVRSESDSKIFFSMLERNFSFQLLDALTLNSVVLWAQN